MSEFAEVEGGERAEGRRRKVFEVRGSEWGKNNGASLMTDCRLQ